MPRKKQPLKKAKPKAETLGRLVFAIRDRLSKAGVFNPYQTAEVIISEALNIPRAQIYLEPERKLKKAELKKIQKWVSERATRKPLSYIQARAWFREIELKVNPSVLLPRMETELLAEEAIKIIKADPSIKKILDLGTGSGAIILSLAFELKELKRKLKFSASDISSPALLTAQKNAEALGLEKKIEFRTGDLFAPFARQKFDLIVCNPPYIPENELEKLMPEVSKFEPRIALNGGKQGLEIIKEILAQAPQRLAPKGWLLLEIGKGQAKKLLKFQPTGLRLTGLVKDYQAIERIAEFQKR